VPSSASDPPLDAASALGLIADSVRLRVVAAIVLGASTLDSVVETAGISTEAAQRALERLIARGIVEVSKPPRTYHLREDVLRRVAREGAAPRDASAVDPSLSPAQQKVVRAFMPDGRLRSIPATRAKRREILDILAARFEPGRTYPERDVNATLRAVHDDVAALRRLLVDEGFLERRSGFYWRAGGTFDV
jgi:hypothetical protein